MAFAPLILTHIILHTQMLNPGYTGNLFHTIYAAWTSCIMQWYYEVSTWLGHLK